ncbi:MAG: GMC family oxidoreductase [Planctomycetota bacterium]|nr:GMC family oxidoreductase [Planctomycetota bacterium]
MTEPDWDFVIVGSGFGGSVSALRLVEKGYRVLLLEKGTRFRPQDFPKTNWNLRRWFWLPALGWRGLFKLTFLRHVTVAHGVGLGGGSLVYANTLPIPEDPFFESSSWVHLAQWKEELSPHYQTAYRMLGAQENPMLTEADEVIRSVAEDLGKEEDFSPAKVAVYFGESGVTVPDPYFDGKGPERTGCIGCGGCLMGCRHGAKNTLDKNYLHLAEQLGLEIRADSEVTWIRPRVGGGYELDVLEGRSRFRFRKTLRRVTARKVILSGGVMGTVDLLLRLSEKQEGLPELSPHLGSFVRTNSESLIGVTSRRKDLDLSRGLAIGSILHTDPYSSLEPTRFSDGSGCLRLLAIPHVAGETLPIRFLRLLGTIVRHPIRILRTLVVPNWARSTILLLYMRSLDGHIKFRRGRSIFSGGRRGLVTGLGEGPVPRASIPEATELAKRVAEKIDGSPNSAFTESFFNIPTTAHILGGCCMGESREEGVIDAQHRVHGYEGLYVIDGSSVSANPGVNPSLTITALAERAMSFIPEKGEA